MYTKTAHKIYGPLIHGRCLRPEFADNDGSGSAWAYSLGCLDALDYIPLGGVAEDIYRSSRDAGQLRGSRDTNLRFPIKATAAEQETYRLHCELRDMTAQRNALLAALEGMMDAFHYDPTGGGHNHAVDLAEAAIHDAKGDRK